MSSVTINPQSQRSSITGQVMGGSQGGADISVIQSLIDQKIADSLKGVNRAPTIPAAVPTTFLDGVTSVTGNLLSGATDADGDTMAVSQITYAGASKQVGVSFSTQYGSMVIESSGSWIFVPSTNAWLLNAGQAGQELFNVIVTDGRGGMTPTSIKLAITGSNQAPTAGSDYFETDYGAPVAISILGNDVDPEGAALTLVRYYVGADPSVCVPGQNVQIGSAGTLTIDANGVGTFAPSQGFSGSLPTITYVISDGLNESIGHFVIAVQPPVAAVISDPVTYAVSGQRTFDVGPGKTYQELDMVPWADMAPGDVVNIFYREAPYCCKIGVSVQATPTSKFIINGVTDQNGNRPKISGIGAKTAAGSMPGTANNVFATGPGSQTFGVITVKRRPGTPTTTNPAWIVIRNLEVFGASESVAAYDSDGTRADWGRSACIWLQPSKDIEITNCVLYDSNFSVFSMAKAGYGPEGSAGEGCERIRLRYNRMYGCGSAGASAGGDHNVYMQCFAPLIEGNYIGPCRTGSQGASYKSRAGMEVFRYNYVEATARAIDFVQPDGFLDGMVTMPGFGNDFCYGNIIVNDKKNGFLAWRPIHYGGDNGSAGEQDPAYGLGSTPVEYRKHLYFWNNTVYSAGSTGASQYLFQISWPDTVIDAWSNVIGMYGTSRMSMLQYCGTLNWRGNNILHTNSFFEDSDGGMPANFVFVNKIGSLSGADPLWTSPTNADFSLGAGSPALDVYSGLPNGIPANIATDYPVKYCPRRKANGVTVRPTIGQMDLGATERDPAAPPASAPINTVAPTLDASGTFAVGGTISFNAGTWIYAPSAYSLQLQWLNGSVWQDVPGAFAASATATSLSYTLTSSEVGSIRGKVTTVNSLNIPSVAYTNVRTVTASMPAPIVQVASGFDGSWPNDAKNAKATFASSPTVGSTLVAFASGADGSGGAITDNYGNVWTRRASVGSGYGGRFLEAYTCVVTGGKTGSNFQVSMATTISYVAGLIVYEMAGVFDSASSSSMTPNAESVSSFNANASSVNQRILAAVMNGRGWGGDNPTAITPWIQDAQVTKAQIYEPTVMAMHGVSQSVGQNVVSANTNSGASTVGISVSING